MAQMNLTTLDAAINNHIKTLGVVTATIELGDAGKVALW